MKESIIPSVIVKSLSRNINVGSLHKYAIRNVVYSKIRQHQDLFLQADKINDMFQKTNQMNLAQSLQIFFISSGMHARYILTKENKINEAQTDFFVTVSSSA